MLKQQTTFVFHLLNRLNKGCPRQLFRGMANGIRKSESYGEAINALNTLQSNAAVIEAIRRSGGKLNDFAIPEMVEYLERIGWKVSQAFFMYHQKLTIP